MMNRDQKSTQLCCIWEQLLDCVVPKVCPWHGEEWGGLPKITFSFWCSSIMEWFWAEEPPEDSISWLKSFAFYFCDPSCENHEYLHKNCDAFLWHSCGKASKRSSSESRQHPPTLPHLVLLGKWHRNIHYCLWIINLQTPSHWGLEKIFLSL